MNALSFFVYHLTLLCFCGLMCWAAVSDFSRYIIPNSVCLAIVALFPAYAMAAPGAVDWVGHATVGAAIFGLGFVFYVFNMTGGGDVKLLAAGSLWAGPQLILTFLIIVAIAGGVLSLLTLTRLRVFRLRPAGGPSFGVRLGSAVKSHVPYGVAIAAGGMFFAARLAGV